MECHQSQKHSSKQVLFLQKQLLLRWFNRDDSHSFSKYWLNIYSGLRFLLHWTYDIVQNTHSIPPLNKYLSVYYVFTYCACVLGWPHFHSKIIYDPSHRCCQGNKPHNWITFVFGDMRPMHSKGLEREKEILRNGQELENRTSPKNSYKSSQFSECSPSQQAQRSYA